MKVVYIAGPYRADTEFGAAMNIHIAGMLALEVWLAGYAALCPHKNTAFFGGAYGLPDETWLRGDLAMLKRCDAVLTVKEWQSSTGTREELRMASLWGIPVYHTLTDLLKGTPPDADL